jgi:hypothetical protein
VSDQKPTPCRIEGWVCTGQPIVGGFFIIADSFVNHPDLGNGDNGIQTTRIQEVRVEGNSRLVRTRNTLYELGEPSKRWAGRIRDQFETAFPYFFEQVTTA